MKPAAIAKIANENEVSKRVKDLRELLALVVENTKRTNLGKPLKNGEETKRNTILSSLLGRKPTPQEMSLVAQY